MAPIRRTATGSSVRFGAALLQAVGVGVAFAALAVGWFGRFHLQDAFTAPDWFDYCSAVVSVLEDDPALWPLKRSRWAGAPAVWAAERLGVVDGLAASAVVGTGAMGGLLYLWGAALGGRGAGLAAALLGLAMGPVVLQARSLTFYPWVTAGLLACGAGAAWVVRRPGVWTGLACGLAVGIALLLDLRALVWALPTLGVAVGALALREGATWRRAVALGALLLPLVWSYDQGFDAYPPATYSLEEQVDVRALYAAMGGGDAAARAQAVPASRYVWGRTPLTDIPGTLGFLVQQARIPRPAGAAALTDPALVAAHVRPWLGVGLLLGPLALWVLRKDRLVALAFVGTALPWVLALRRMPDMVNLYPRFLAQGLPVLAVAGGGWRRRPGRGRPWARGGAARRGRAFWARWCSGCCRARCPRPRGGAGPGRPRWSSSTRPPRSPAATTSVGCPWLRCAAGPRWRPGRPGTSLRSAAGGRCATTSPTPTAPGTRRPRRPRWRVGCSEPGAWRERGAWVTSRRPGPGRDVRHHRWNGETPPRTPSPPMKGRHDRARLRNQVRTAARARARIRNTMQTEDDAERDDLDDLEPEARASER